MLNAESAKVLYQKWMFLILFPTADEDLKFILLKRPKISIVANYKINTKAAHNHFQRYSDVKVKGQGTANYSLHFRDCYVRE